MGFGVVVVWRLVVVGAAGYWTIILPPPHLAEREKPNWDIPPPPGIRGVAYWMASGVVLLLHIICIPPPQLAETDAQLRHPPHRAGGWGVSLATHPPGLGYSHTRLHSHGARNEPSPRPSCHYWLSRQLSRKSSVNRYWLRLFCC